VIAATSWRANALCLLVLIAIPLVIFRSHVIGDTTYIGNPDRLNSHLKILKFHVEGLARGSVVAWNDYEMLGFDSLTMPYTYPNILTYLTYWLDPAYLYITAGYASPLLLLLAGIAAFIFLRRLDTDPLAALVGAVLYECSALSILMVSQNDMSFAAIVLIPLLALAARRTSALQLSVSYALLSVLLFALLQFMFLQYAAYAVMLIGVYAAYRSLDARSWAPAGVFAGALLTATLGALPRLYGIGRAMSQYTRSIPGRDFATFEQVYAFQNVRPHEILRWFDDRIFGAFPSQVMSLAGNNINITEGFPLYTSTLVPFLTLFGLLRYRRSWFALLGERRNDSRFFVWFLMFTFSVILFRPMTYALYLLFLRVDFTHARILIAGLLPLVVVMSVILTDLGRGDWPPPTRRNSVAMTTGALGLAVVVAVGLEWGGSALPGFSHWSHLGISRAALLRIAASGLVAALCLAVLSWRRRRACWCRLTYQTLCYAMMFQAVLSADFQVNGPHTRAASTPFQWGDIYAGTRNEFRPPSEGAIRALHTKLEQDKFRAALICSSSVTGSFCGGHVPGFWRLRVVDGYYGLGVPTRLAVLPWGGAAISLRTIGFREIKELPWSLLGLLNVKYAVVVDDYLYRHTRFRGGGAREAERRLEEVKTIANPTRVYPRAFFARSTTGVATVADAVLLLFAGKDYPKDVINESFVEGFPGTRAFSTGGTIAWSGRGDAMTLELQPSAAERFLVVNELYFPGWRAEIDGSPARIYPTNCYMRGLLVPPGARTVSFTFVPFVRTAAASIIQCAAAVCFIAGVVACRLLERAARRSGPGGGSLTKA
jgi:hypothetical protein